MHNLAEQPQYQRKLGELRQALYAQLGNHQGQHVIPYSPRLSVGAVRRDRNGTGPAPFPQSWMVGPDMPDRLDGFLPDTEAKLRSHEAGQPFAPSMPLRESIEVSIDRN